MRTLTHTLMALAFSALGTLTAGAQQVEYFWDTDPGVGNGQVLQTFSGTSAKVQAEIDVSGLTTGIHLLGLRTLNDVYYSSTYYRSFYVPAAEETITRIEYGWDENPAVGEGTALDFKSGNVVNLSQDIPVNGLHEGVHTLYLRALSTGHQSLTYTRSFYIPATPHEVEAIEYFFDTDPGVGNGTQMAATINGGELAKAFNVDTDGLTAGIHHIGLRTLTDGTWSATMTRQFLVRNVNDGYVVRMECFWGVDPGKGLGIPIELTPGKEVTLDFEVDMSTFDEGIYTFGLRAQSGAGFWTDTWLAEGIEHDGMRVDLDENATTAPTEIAGVNVHVIRTINAGEWSTICLPFAMTEAQVKAAFGDDVQIADFMGYSTTKDGGEVMGIVVNFDNVTAIEANHPYIIKVSEKVTEFTVKGVDIEPDDKPCVEYDNGLTGKKRKVLGTFTGTYVADFDFYNEAQYYPLFLSGNKFYYATENTKHMKAFRAYFDFTDYLPEAEGADSRIIMSIGGNTDSAVRYVTTESQQMEQVYDLQGRKLSNSQLSSRQLKKGLYIVNGKKVVK